MWAHFVEGHIDPQHHPYIVTVPQEHWACVCVGSFPCLFLPLMFTTVLGLGCYFLFDTQKADVTKLPKVLHLVSCQVGSEFRFVWIPSLMNCSLTSAKATLLPLCTSSFSHSPFTSSLLQAQCSVSPKVSHVGQESVRKRRLGGERGGCLKTGILSLSLPKNGIKPLPRCRCKWSVI